MNKAVALRRDDGYTAFIVPDTITNNDSYAATRNSLTSAGLNHVVRLDFEVFDGPSVRTAIPIVGPSQPVLALSAFDSYEHFQSNTPFILLEIEREDILKRPHCKWPFATSSSDDLLERLRSVGNPLKSLAETRDGVNPGPRSFRDRVINPTRRRPSCRPMIQGSHILRYSILPTSDVIDYDDKLLTPDLKKQGASFRNPGVFQSPKLVNRQTANTLIFALDDNDLCAINSVHNTHALDGDRDTLRYLLGVLNSSLLGFYYRQNSQETRKIFPQVHISALRELPIRTIDFTNKSDKAAHDRMVKLVDRMLDLHKKLAAAKSPVDKEHLPREIEATDRQIDQLVYELYGLTEDEIRIVEQATGPAASKCP